MERYICGKRRNELGKKFRYAYENHLTGFRRCQLCDLTIVSKQVSNTITTIVNDNLLCVIDFINIQEE